MIPRRAYIKRRVRPRPQRRGKTAARKRSLAQLWSQVVRAKNDGRCVMMNYDFIECAGRLDPAHAWPKNVAPAVRLHPDFGEPVCRAHHEAYANRERWFVFLMRYWGAEIYATRYAQAHVAGLRESLDEVTARLREATA